MTLDYIAGDIIMMTETQYSRLNHSIRKLYKCDEMLVYLFLSTRLAFCRQMFNCQWSFGVLTNEIWTRPI